MAFKDAKDYDIKLPHHNLGRTAWNKGICHLSDEARKRISEANLGKISPMKGKSQPKSSAPIYTSKNRYGNEQLTLSQWSRKLGYDRATIAWHFNRWGNLDRLGQKYHEKRATVYWGKTCREWHEYIAKNCADGQKVPSRGSVGETLRKGEDFFLNFYLAKKLGTYTGNKARYKKQSKKG
jgi:hypothetical protein